MPSMGSQAVRKSNESARMDSHLEERATWSNTACNIWERWKDETRGAVRGMSGGNWSKVAMQLRNTNFASRRD